MTEQNLTRAQHLSDRLSALKTNKWYFSNLSFEEQHFVKVVEYMKALSDELIQNYKKEFNKI